MKKHFFTGLVALLPIALTVIIIIWLFNFFTTPFAGLTESLVLSYEQDLKLSPEHHHTLVLFLSRLLALIFLIALIFFLGFFGQKFLMKLLLNSSQLLLSKIPLVRTIFNMINDITKALLSENAKTFEQTVLLPFPQKDYHSLGFITKEAPPILKKSHPKIEVAVFIPTAPHPISGFLLLVPRHETTPVDLSTEEAFKFLISCGTLHPTSSKQ